MERFGWTLSTIGIAGMALAGLVEVLAIGFAFVTGSVRITLPTQAFGVVLIFSVVALVGVAIYVAGKPHAR